MARQMSDLLVRLREWFGVSVLRLAEFSVVSAVLITAEPTALSLWVGGLASLSGQSIRLAAAGYRRPRDQFSVYGPYRLVRHPHLLGSLLLFSGFALAGRDPFVMAYTMSLLGLVYLRVATVQEARLAAFSPVRFRSYQADVPAFLPRLVPISADADSAAFSLRKALLGKPHREAGALVLLAAAYGALWLMIGAENRTLLHQVFAGMICVFIAFRLIFYAFQKTYRPA